MRGDQDSDSTSSSKGLSGSTYNAQISIGVGIEMIQSILNCAHVRLTLRYAHTGFEAPNREDAVMAAAIGEDEWVASGRGVYKYRHRLQGKTLAEPLLRWNNLFRSGL
jgi:hypothetical protein